MDQEAGAVVCDQMKGTALPADVVVQWSGEADQSSEASTKQLQDLEVPMAH